MNNAFNPDNDEPSILDYLKSQLRLNPEPAQRQELTDLRLQETFGPDRVDSSRLQQKQVLSNRSTVFLWITVPLMLIAQESINVSNSLNEMAGLFLYVISIILLLIGFHHENINLPINEQQKNRWTFYYGKYWLIFTGVILLVLSYVLFTDGYFRLISTIVWITGLVMIMTFFWAPSPKTPIHVEPFYIRLKTFLNNRYRLVIGIVVTGIVLFFRFFRITDIPPELISTQVDHFYTIKDILQGISPLTFPRNIVSEPLQYYWSALSVLLLGGGTSITAIRVAYSIAGIIGDFFLYKLGSLLVNKSVGIIAAFLFGVAFWPNIQIRSLLGSGFVLPILIPCLYFFMRGMLTKNSNNLLVSGVLTGLGVMTHKQFLVIPLTYFLLMLLWLLSDFSHKRVSEVLQASLRFFMMTIATILPYLRAIIIDPDSYFRIILSRMTSFETPLPGNPVILFFHNLVSALGMVNWRTQGNWVEGIPNHASVDTITGVFFILGFIVLFVEYQKRKQWVILSLMVLFPILLIPSVMSLAFPVENPSLSRALGASLPVFMIAAIGLEFFFRSTCQKHLLINRNKSMVLALIITFPILFQNFRITFQDYPRLYSLNAWNAAEMAQAIEIVEKEKDEIANVWVVAYPYWVDARAIAIELKRSSIDFAIGHVDLEYTKNLDGLKLYLLNSQDTIGYDELKNIYPNGTLQLVESSQPEKSFHIFVVTQ